MKQKRLLIVLLLALVCGGAAAYLSVTYMGQTAAPKAAAQTRTDQMAVASRDLPVGTVLRAEDVRMIGWSGALPAGYANSAATVIGRGLITPVVANEPLLTSKLADKEAGGGLPIMIPEGKRAVSVKVDEVIGVAGFVTPGTRVDVLVTMSPGGDNRQSNVTRVILQNIQTLAAGQTVQRDVEGKPQTVTVITLLVTPDQAEELTLAANDGRIQLALRNTLDVTETKTSGVRAAALLGEGGTRTTSRSVRTVEVRATSRPARGASVPQGASAPRQTGTTVVETIRGGERTLSTFSSGGS